MLRREFLKLMPAMVLPVGLGNLQCTRASAADGSFGVGLNLSGIVYWTDEHPFRNLATAGSNWDLRNSEGRTLTRPVMSDDGYPLEVPHGTYFESFLIFTPYRTHLAKTQVVQYDGVGEIDYAWGAELIERRSGSDLIRNLDNGQALTARIVATDPANPIRNLRLWEEGRTEGGTFRPEFIERLTGMSVIRFMDWMDTNNSRISNWADRPRYDRYSQVERGAALEIMVDLSNQLRVPPWFTLPHLADDEYVRAFATQVRQTLDPTLNVYVEYLNEVWNNIFEQADYAKRMGTSLGLSDDAWEASLRYYSQRTSEILTIWEDIFGGDGRRVVGVYSAQAATPWTSEVILSWADAKEHADVLAIAPYFGATLGWSEKAPSVSQWSLDELFADLSQEVRGHNSDLIAKQAAVASRFSVQLIAYEGGQHLAAAGPAMDDERLCRLFENANRDMRMGELYRDHIANWRKEGGGIYAFFNSMGAYNKWGSWGLIERESLQAASSKWAEVRRLIGT